MTISEAKIQLQISDAVTQIADSDFPQKWQGLVPVRANNEFGIRRSTQRENKAIASITLHMCLIIILFFLQL